MRVRIRPSAFHDLRGAGRWYESKRRGLGREFVMDVWAVLEVIADHPARYPVIHERVRRALIRRFPYAVFYRVEQDCVDVLAVLHGHRDPETWPGSVREGLVLPWLEPAALAAPDCGEPV